MKKINLIALIIFASSALNTNAITKVTIENSYNKPIIIYINGNKYQQIGANNYWEIPTNIWDITSTIKFRVSDNIVSYHTSIQDEFKKIKDAASRNSNVKAIINISEKNLFHFNYKTSIDTSFNPPTNASIKQMGDNAIANLVRTKFAQTLTEIPHLLGAIEQGYYGPELANRVNILKNIAYDSSRESSGEMPKNHPYSLLKGNIEDGLETKQYTTAATIKDLVEEKVKSREDILNLSNQKNLRENPYWNNVVE